MYDAVLTYEGPRGSFPTWNIMLRAWRLTILKKIYKSNPILMENYDIHSEFHCLEKNTLFLKEFWTGYQNEPSVRKSSVIIRAWFPVLIAKTPFISTTPDVDECMVNNGGCQELCDDQEGSYSCSCAQGHILAPDMHSCQGENTKKCP
jgi:hypothetical protein